MKRVDPATARALILGAQGLLEDPARPATKAALRRAIESLGFVQIDSIATVARAHHLTLQSRFDRYQPETLARLLEEDRSLFEQWTHDAAAIPTIWFPHWKHRFDREHARVHTSKWWLERFGSDVERELERVEERVRREGPILAKDFEGPRAAKSGWWEWKPAKAALELLWRTGRLSIARRVHFQKVYDLTERVLPEQHAAEPPTWEEHIAWAARGALERLVFAAASEVAAFWHAISIADAKRWLDEADTRGEVERVELEPSTRETRPRIAYALRGWERRAARLAPAPDRIRFLSPFDPIVHDRRRAERYFEFEYRFEAFVPEPKRKYGYYVLPMLEGDRLVGRISPKMHREQELLEVRGVWWERAFKPARTRRARFDEALERFAAQLGARKIKRLRV